MTLPTILRQPADWFFQTPERALDRAYRAALKIKNIEDKYFNGQKVAAEFSQYGESTFASLKTEVQGYLQNIRMRLTEFRASRLFLILSEAQSSKLETSDRSSSIETNGQALGMLDKLNFIDEILAKYKTPTPQLSFYRDEWSDSQAAKEQEANGSGLKSAQKNKPKLLSAQKNIYSENKNGSAQEYPEKASEKTGVLPRSFLNTLMRIRQEIDPKTRDSEEQVLKRFRNSRYKTAISIKFVLLLVIIPLLTHQLTKTFVMSPLVENYFKQHEQVVFINKNFEEEALVELQRFEESLHFKSLIGLAPKMSQEEIEAQLKEKAQEISASYREVGIDAIANIFADLCSLVAFGVVIVTNRKEIEILKSFIDGIAYGLSDSAKAFLIILFTDMFVGFHSPHGWEVLLEGVSRHFGLPENREFNGLFIATFPVILDTVFKYWIFRYLNRISPSAVATYKNMNE
jgi:hypothetical protein